MIWEQKIITKDTDTKVIIMIK